MYNNRSKGFTLIELLVVIAIIGILSAVVLASLNTARYKGNDAAIQSDLSTIRTQAEIFYGIGDTYTGVCADATIVKALAGASKGNGGTAPTCNVLAVSGAAYAVSSKLSTARTAGTPDYWCVDSTGSTSKSTTALAAGTTAALTVCPASN
jgi:prepilin-type N-terminal cleavage/methylation domain-containing protein